MMDKICLKDQNSSNWNLSVMFLPPPLPFLSKAESRSLVSFGMQWL